MIRARVLLFAVLTCLATQGRAQVITSNFNTDADGWTAYGGADLGATISYSGAGGNGGTGAITLNDPANGRYDYFLAPAKFTGDLAAYYGGALNFDLKLNPAWDSIAETAMVILTGTFNSGTLAIGYLPATGQYPTTGSFTTYSLALNTATAWAVVDSSDFVTGTLATTPQIQAVMSSISSLRILGDWTNSPDHVLLDNVTLTAIPEPSALALVSAAGFGAGLLVIRRRTARR